jgi:hypothetical protein
MTKMKSLVKYESKARSNRWQNISITLKNMGKCYKGWYKLGSSYHRTLKWNIIH